VIFQNTMVRQDYDFEKIEFLIILIRTRGIRNEKILGNTYPHGGFWRCYAHNRPAKYPGG
jgi:hypothetical protein